jgi:hypothetical protein
VEFSTQLPFAKSKNILDAQRLTLGVCLLQRVGIDCEFGKSAQ